MPEVIIDFFFLKNHNARLIANLKSQVAIHFTTSDLKHDLNYGPNVHLLFSLAWSQLLKTSKIQLPRIKTYAKTCKNDLVKKAMIVEVI